MSEAAPRLMNSIDSILEDKVLMMTYLDLKKGFPIYHVCPTCLAALLCGSALRKNVATSLQVFDEVRMTLVHWSRGNFHCELIQHPENLWNPTYNLLHFSIPVFGKKIPI